MLPSTKRKLFKLFKTNKKNLTQKNNDLIGIISDFNLVKNVYYKLRYNFNYLFTKTVFIDNKVSLRLLKQLSEQIKTNSYK